MEQIKKVSTTLLIAGALSLSTQAGAFIDPEEWKMDKWGKWDEWEGVPDMNKWRQDQWGEDIDQWVPGGN
ncbi:MAG TPA: hypothetical protein HPP65_14340, partial [Gammaproteobacteria bacterium]|nr:hypothetical protein [Gammaproteobacteria bacterium]